MKTNTTMRDIASRAGAMALALVLATTTVPAVPGWAETPDGGGGSLI